MIRFAPCKINLGLHVVEKRPDGYHNLETCFYPVPWCDVVEVVPAAELTFSMSGREVPGPPDTNLCLRAYGLLQKEFSLPPVAIHLHKVVPTGAGLGGGSADGAHTLRALNDVFDLQLSREALLPFAARLGSDCAFFLYDEPMLGTGRGEVLSPLPVSLKDYFLVLVKPELHVSTAEAYAGIVPRQPARELVAVLREPVTTWRNLLMNDFEHTVFQKFPEIAAIKSTLYQQGAVYAAMSGSGAAVFGLFEAPVDVRHHFENSVCWSATLAV